MIKRLFVFSDMQFNDCRAHAQNDWTTDHMAITKAYEAAGYQVPEIVSAIPSECRRTLSHPFCH